MSGVLQFVCLLLGVLVVADADAVHAKVSEELRVTLPHGGRLIGKYMTSHRGRGIRAFLGLPYAEPPTGDLRFQPPFPKLPWTGVYEATDGNRKCLQPFEGGVVGDEDCLYANIYSPLRPRSKGPLPVMVYFHGGAFAVGGGDITTYSPEYLLDHDVILVVGNYRLGVLGFLSTATAALPGNMGLKDQHLLLQWVQDNIESFGGNARQVTLFGNSAGSASVGFHLISKLSVGLFHRAIMQSGTQYAPWALDNLKQNANNAVRLASELDCELQSTETDDDVAEFLSCIRAKCAREIVQKTSEIFQQVPFLPNVEPSIEGFIQKRPREYRRSVGLNIPVIIGITRDEGAVFTGSTLGSDTEAAWQAQRDALNHWISLATTFDDVDQRTKEEVQKLTSEFYFKDGAFNRENLQNVTDFFSDGFFVSPLDDFMVNRLVTNSNSAPTFVYLFSHRGAVSFPDIFPPMGIPGVQIDEDLGVSHVDECFYLFPMAESYAPHIVPREEDTLIQATLTEMWVNFATKGEPLSSTLEHVDWRPATGYPLDYLRIGNYGGGQSSGEVVKDIVGMESGLMEERVNLWRELKSITATAASTHGGTTAKNGQKRNEL